MGVVAHSIACGALIATITTIIAIAVVTIAVAGTITTAAGGPQSTCSREVALQPSNLLFFVFIVYVNFIFET